MKNLRVLTLGNSTVTDLSWISQLDKLTQFNAYNCRKLHDFTPIGTCLKINKLAISGSKLLGDLNFLSPLKDLEVLDTSDNGEIETLAHLRHLENLKAIAFPGSVIKDGDLSVLEQLPKLSMLMFQPKKHYTHKLIKKWDWNNLNHPDKLLECNT